MRMSDVMSALGLAAFPIAAMVLFLLVFVGVLRQVLRRSSREEFERAAMLPLSESGESTPADAKEQMR